MTPEQIVAARVADGYGPCACDPEMRDAIRALIAEAEARAGKGA